MKSRPLNRLVVGTAEDCPDIEYSTGFKPVDAVVVLIGGRKKAMVVPTLEYGRACEQATGVDVYIPEMLGLRAKRRGSISGWAVALLKKYNIKKVTVAPTLYHAVATKVIKSGVRLSMSKGLLLPEREIKSAAEVKMIAESQQAAVIAMRHSIALIHRSTVDHAGYLRVRGKHLTSEYMLDSATQVLVDHGCICRHMIIAGGKQSANPHETGHGKLRAGEPIIMDIFPQHMTTGYWGDLTRTVIKGKATTYQKKMYNAVKAAQSRALALLRPGVTGKTVHMAVCKEFERRKFPLAFAEDRGKGFRHSTGHGVGLCIHESPGLGISATGRLKKGHVVTVEPGWYDPQMGGVRIEDTVVITATGWKYLVPCEKRFEV